MNAFEKAVKHTVGIEGDFSDDPADSGGKTRFGITESVARAYGYTGDMDKLPIGLARRIYRENYWDLLRLDKVAELSEDIAAELFDTAVNCGVGFAGRCLQRSLNAFNNEGAHYADLRVDNLVGTATIAALRSYLDKRGTKGEMVMLRTLNGLQTERYISLVERRSKDERFVYGQILNRVQIKG